MNFAEKNDFRKQIAEDIKDYQEKYPNINNICKEEWSFNFWVLDKLFFEDENVIEDKIVDYNDKGIDCYVWHEELKNLYLIQNKYYDDNSNVSVDYFFNDFLTRSIGALEKGTYNRSPELQKIFNKYSCDDDFQIYFYLYVTNNNVNDELINKIKNYNLTQSNRVAKIFYLEDINNLYFREPKVDKKDLSAIIGTINKGTILNIDTEHYDIDQALDARYALTPVVVLYNLFQDAKKQNYPIFDANIREYLGAKGSTNKNIKNTLQDPNDRKNFFFYNNGITIICEDIKSIQTGSKIDGCNAWFEIKNPQIVNGCQTVSTINEVLDQFLDSKRFEEFKNTYVMAKFLKITDQSNSLYKQIVRYNNSQNAIDEKTFVANKEEFIRIQNEFERRGLLVAIKQSDNYKFVEKYKIMTELINRSKSLLDKFGLSFKTVKDFIIPLEKLLQVFLAYRSGAQQAYQKKSQLLVVGSNQYETVIQLIKDPNFTINQMIDLYLFYALCEQKKKDSEDKKIPVSFYVIDGIRKFEIDKTEKTIDMLLKDAINVEKLFKIYSMATNIYYSQMKTQKEIEYNNMIKSELDYKLFEQCVDIAKQSINY